jgi:DNA-binding NtrC family response regulator
LQCPGSESNQRHADFQGQRFRSDLYFRLAVICVRLPPLREHAADLPQLVDSIVAALGAAGTPEAELVRRPEFLAALATHPWPGNVRELRNHIERCLALRSVEPPAGSASRPDTAETGALDDLRRARDEWERRYLEELLARHGGNVSAAARAAKIDRKYLYKLLWRSGLR